MVGLPVWFQTPLVLAALALAAVAVATALLWVLFRVLPRDESERKVFGEKKGASLAGTVETQDCRTTGQCLGPCMYEWLHPLTVRMWKVREILKLFQCIGRTRKGLITRQASPQQMNARQCK